MAAKQLNVRPLTEQEAAFSGYTHMAVIKAGAEELNDSVADDDQTLNLFQTQAGDVIEKIHLHLDPAFQDVSDAAFNDTKISVGDEDSATRFVSAVQANVNGTEVIDTYENTAYSYSAVKQVTAKVEAMTAKALANLDAGKAIILFKLNRAAKDLVAAAQ